MCQQVIDIKQDEYILTKSEGNELVFTCVFSLHSDRGAFTPYQFENLRHQSENYTSVGA